ncbi:hypothetical protein Tco_0533485 [Tanacetum coccineum]
MPSNVKTYDGSDDQKDHLKFFQADAKVERWAMPTWCHMFNSTLTGSTRVWFDDLPPESVDSYDDLKKAFLANFLQQKKCIKDPVEIHHIKISNPELIKRLHDKITKSVDEMMKVTTAYLKKEVAASNQVRKKTLPRSERRREKFTLLIKSPKEILALDKGKFKTPPAMTTPAEKRNNNKFCEFHGEVGHNTDECMHLKRQIKELIKAGKLWHVIKELKQGSGKHQPKAAKKGETSGKDKAMAILIVQPWKRVARKRVARKRVTQRRDKLIARKMLSSCVTDIDPASIQLHLDIDKLSLPSPVENWFQVLAFGNCLKELSLTICGKKLDKNEVGCLMIPDAIFSCENLNTISLRDDKVELYKVREALDISSNFDITIKNNFVPLNIDLDDLRRIVPFPARNVQLLSFGEHLDTKLLKHSPLFDFLFSICHPHYVKAYYRSSNGKNYWYEQMIRMIEQKTCDLNDIEIKNPRDGKWESLTNSWRNYHFLCELPRRSFYDEGNDYNSDEFKLNWLPN